MSDFQYAPPSLRPAEAEGLVAEAKMGRRLKKRWVVLVVGLLLIISAPVALGVMFAQAAYQPSVPEGEVVQLTVSPGESIDQIADNLASKGLIDQPMFFRLYLRFFAGEASIQAGSFAIPQHISMSDLISMLGVAEREQVVLQFLEGWRREEMAEYIDSQFQEGKVGFSGDHFSQLALNPPASLRSVLGERLPSGVSLQGYLFPDTYHIDQNATAEDLISTMLQTYMSKVDSQVVDGIKSQGLSEREGLILAAIVEREAFAGNERPVIAEILLKRLRTGEILGTDATLQYALGYSEEEDTWWRKMITLDDLEMDSPYNTRRKTGLPPAPIANPGIEAIKAVASPATTDYLYYLHDANGQIHYASSLDEHNMNVARHLQ